MQALLDVSTAGDQLADADDDAVIEAVACDRRRRALDALAESDSELALSELAERVHRIEADDDANEGARRDVAVSLHHKHLPLLDDIGVVEYDADDRDVALDVDPDAFELDGALVA